MLAIAAAVAQSAPEDIKVLETSFVQQDLSGGTMRVTPTRRIKYAPGTSCYSWIIRVVPQRASVTIREHFKLPAPATQWNSDPVSTNVSQGRKEASTNVQESLEDGILTNGWCVAEGDPTGQHVIEVFHGKRRLHQFMFEISEETY